MTLTRRAFVHGGAALTAGALAFPAIAKIRGPVSLVVGYLPGGPADVIARALIEPMRTALGTAVIVENRPGAGGRIAADQLRSRPGDGKVLLVSPASVVTMAPHLYKSVRYELTRDFLPLAPVARLDLGLYAGPGVPENLHTLGEVAKWLRETPSKCSCGMPGLGSTPHLAALLLGRAMKVDWQLVPYQGDNPGFLALLAGEIPVHLGSLSGGMEHLRAGKVRLLTLTSGERSSFAPEVPTATQQGYDVIVEDRHSVFAPKSTGDEVAATLRHALQEALAAPAVGDMLQGMSLQRSASTNDFAGQLKAESDRWARSIKALNVSLEG